ncbi:MAG: hypothetical protein ACJ8BW_02885 [Ktedonobacteraceae bacterium]
MEVYLEEEALRDMTSLYIMCGLSYAGKSTLSKALVDRFGFSLVLFFLVELAVDHDIFESL